MNILTIVFTGLALVGGLVITMLMIIQFSSANADRRAFYDVGMLMGPGMTAEIRDKALATRFPLSAYMSATGRKVIVYWLRMLKERPTDDDRGVAA